jgi:hypothetical protein
MLEDVVEAITEYEKRSTAGQCEALIYHLDNTVRYARELMTRAHAILEVRIKEERQIETSKRSPDFPKSQTIGAN